MIPVGETVHCNKFMIMSQIRLVYCYCLILNMQASTQTDAMRVPSSRRRQMKNKSVLCRPFTMDQESMCQLPSTESGGNCRNHLNMFCLLISEIWELSCTTFSNFLTVKLSTAQLQTPAEYTVH